MPNRRNESLDDSGELCHKGQLGEKQGITRIGLRRPLGPEVKGGVAQLSSRKAIGTLQKPLTE